MRVLATAMAMAGGAMAADCKPGFHCTNSHLHKEVRAFPLQREGHHRGSIKPMPKYAPDHFSIMSRVMDIKVAEREQCEARDECPRFYNRADSTIPCVNGQLSTSDETFDCLNTDVLGFVPIRDMDSDREASDIWGWTDPVYGEQIAIIGMEDRTAFVKVTRQQDGSVTPVVLATLLQSGKKNVIWSDMKVYSNHVFIVRESNHGMQVYNLENLRQYYSNERAVSLGQDDLTDFYGVVDQIDLAANIEAGVNATRAPSANVHNIVINEETAFAYLVGSQTCNGGLHAVDISDFGTDAAEPKARFAGCFSADGYTHDAQCVVYHGPDYAYQGKEICWAYNEDTITVVDVSNKNEMTMISRRTYENAKYTHQGWLTEDHVFVIANDELDEIQTSDKRTRTQVWDYSSLANPVLKGFRFSADEIHSVDHNLYIKGNRIYLANYCAGLRVYEISGDIATSSTDDLQLTLPEVAFFDSAPYCDTATDEPIFQGSWSSYPYFEDSLDGQMVIMSNIETGLFILNMK